MRSLIFVAAMLVSIFSLTPAFSGIQKTAEEARFAESSLEDCSEKKSDKELLACITNAIDAYGKGLGNFTGPGVAPEVPKIVQKSAVELKKVNTLKAAANILSKTRTRLRRDAKRKSADAAAIYKRVALTFSKALRILKKRI